MLSSIQFNRYMRCGYNSKGIGEKKRKKKRKTRCRPLVVHGLRTAHISSVLSSPNAAMSTECNEPGPSPREMSDEA